MSKELPPLPEGLRHALLNAHIDGDELLAYGRACRQAVERELAEVRGSINLYGGNQAAAIMEIMALRKERDALRAKLDAAQKLLRLVRRCDLTKPNELTAVIDAMCKEIDVTHAEKPADVLGQLLATAPRGSGKLLDDVARKILEIAPHQHKLTRLAYEIGQYLHWQPGTHFAAPGEEKKP